MKTKIIKKADLENKEEDHSLYIVLSNQNKNQWINIIKDSMAKIEKEFENSNLLKQNLSHNIYDKASFDKNFEIYSDALDKLLS